MKYKVGDKVRVRTDLKLYKQYGSNVAMKEMCEAGGKIVTISKVIAGGWYKIEGGDSPLWTDEMFQTSPKGLIEPGSIVECRSGEKFIYLNGFFMHSGGSMYLGDAGINTFDDDLIFKPKDKDFDIMRIFKSKSITLNDFFAHRNLNLVWERREPKEMTLEEVEKELGYPIKIVKGE